MDNRVILHSDANCFYAAVEMLRNPRLRDIPMVVGGSAESRHGIILTANYVAKRKAKIKVGMAIWEAKQVCPDLVVVPPNYEDYLHFSKELQAIYSEYTDLVEPFGLDESWLDVTGSTKLFGSGIKIALDISKRVKRELGLTLSIGVSWNKIYAKLGSDLKKPDAITYIGHDNYKEVVFPLPASDLLYVGPATTKKLARRGVTTIGALAETSVDALNLWFGKIGLVLHTFANGWDLTPVSKEHREPMIKSIGNSSTTVRDLICDEDVKIMLYVLGESVAMRLRENGYSASLVSIYYRDKELNSFTRQHKLTYHTNLVDDIVNSAFTLFKANYNFENKLPLRSIGVRAGSLIESSTPQQTTFETDAEKQAKREKLEASIDGLRNRYGNPIVQRGLLYVDSSLAHLDAKKDNIIHPVGYFGREV